ncbi:uncharacterized protein LOC131947434 [Physella acuta]|uniref:uncharacterized protein LOC131947434 n=1 Tax=Physella acuta TaxID=109671 RepID=UPI0027DD1C8E|nr:uncharacterized protein LOC131947434 [Physella acuta]
MPTRIQVKVVTEQIQYLEEQLQVLEPVINFMKNVVTKSKAWLEEKTDQSSVSYIELSQKLDTAATALLDVTSHISDENNKTLDKTSTQFEKMQLKHSVMYKLLQQKLMPIDRLIQIFNQNLENRKERINKLGELENTISKFLCAPGNVSISFSFSFPAHLLCSFLTIALLKLLYW